MAGGRATRFWVLRQRAKLLVWGGLGIMVAVQTSSTIQRGTDWDFSFQLQEDGPCSEYADLTNWFVSATLKTAAGASLTTPSIVRDTPEVVSLRLTNTQTAALSAQIGAQLVVNVQRPDGWDIRLIEARTTIC